MLVVWARAAQSQSAEHPKMIEARSLLDMAAS
jgi:hypothetical protein